MKRKIEERKEKKRIMLRISIEELSALNLVLEFMSVSELLNAAMKSLADDDNATALDKEKSDLCWKILKTLKN